MNRAIVGGISREELRKTIQSFGRTWLRWQPQFCSWCHTSLTEDDIDGYAEWCVELGKHVRNRTSENRVPCRSCAGPAMSEVVDGIRFSPNVRPGTEPSDPWSRPRWSEEVRA